MTRLDIIKKQYDMACHNLLVYSSNYLMDSPKTGFELEWKQAKAECELLEEWLEELPGSFKTIKFVGTINSYSRKLNLDKVPYFDLITIEGRDEIVRLFQMTPEAGSDILNGAYDVERHRRYDKGLSTDIIFTVTNFSQRIVSWEWKENDQKEDF